MIFFAMLAIKVLRPLCEHFLFTWQNLIINYELFLEYREEILIMRECLMLIRNLTKNEMTI